jgi:hypothetical protein
LEVELIAGGGLTLWSLFEPKEFLLPEDEAWHLQTWLWMLRHFGGIERLRASPIVTPTDACFPPTDVTGENLARYVFDRVKTQAAMDNLSFRLIPQPSSDADVRSGSVVRPEGKVVEGTFSEESGQIVITYDLAKTQEPLTLVSIFAHELAHYPIAHAGEEPPGGSEMKEFATDLMTVFLGFGIFGADCAVKFWAGPGRGGGWGSSTLGYLREVDWVYALAVFLNLRGEDDSKLKNYLKPALYSELKTASHILARNPEKLEEHRNL